MKRHRLFQESLNEHKSALQNAIDSTTGSLAILSPVIQLLIDCEQGTKSVPWENISTELKRFDEVFQTVHSSMLEVKQDYKAVDVSAEMALINSLELLENELTIIHKWLQVESEWADSATKIFLDPSLVFLITLIVSLIGVGVISYYFLDFSQISAFPPPPLLLLILASISLSVGASHFS